MLMKRAKTLIIILCADKNNLIKGGDFVGEDIFSNIAKNYSDQDFQRVLDSAKSQEVKNTLIASRKLAKEEQN